MKKIRKLSAIASLIALLLLLTGCPGLTEPPAEVTPPAETPVLPKDPLSFNFTGAKAIASAEGTGASGNFRSGAEASGLVKILEDGTIESLITVPDGVTLSPISFIAQSPVAGSKDIYVVFSSSTWYNFETTVTNEDGTTRTEWISGQIGQLLCVHEDGTYDDILKSDDGTWKWLYTYSDADPIAFDGIGNMYYLVSESSGSSTTNMIYCYDPKTAASKQLTSAVSGTYYQQFQVSTDGKLIFAEGYRWSSSSSTHFLRAIPVADPGSFTNIFYSSGSDDYLSGWIYDEIREMIYFSASLSGTRGLFKLSKEADGTFNPDNKENLYGSGSSSFYSSDYITSEYLTVYAWYDSISINNYDADGNWVSSTDASIKTNDILDPVKLLDALIEHANINEEFTTKITKDTVDFRFDIFKNYPGYEALATATEGKKDAEALAILSNDTYTQLLGSLLNEYYVYYNGVGSQYKRNFLADTLYVEGEDTLLKNSTGSYFKKTDSNYNYNGKPNMLSSSYEDRYNWRSDYLKEDGTPDAAKILEGFYSVCTKGGEREFRLTSFKNSLKYGDLYTELINEDAVLFLSTSSKLNTLSSFISNSYDSNNSYNKFIYDTCFIKGTDTHAYTWKTSSGGYVQFNWINDFILIGDGSVWCETRYYDGSKSTNMIVQLLDKNGDLYGEIDEIFKTVSASDFTSGSQSFYFKNSILSTSGSESGYHDIRRYTVATNSIDNLFTNVPNNTSMEVVSYTVGPDTLYYCGVRGLDIVTGKINLATLAHESLKSSVKMTQIIIVK